MGIAEIKAKIAAQKAAQAAAPSPSSAPSPKQAATIQQPVQTNLPIRAPSKNLPSGSELFDKVIDLQEALLDRHPRMPSLLREIHTTLRAQPENVTLLSEDQISIIVNGLKIQTGVEFAATATKSSSKNLKAKIASQGLDAF